MSGHRGEVAQLTNGNDILKRFVGLEDLLCASSDGVVTLILSALCNTVEYLAHLANNTRVKHSGLGVKRVDSRVDTKLGNGTGQHSRGVQVGEGGGGSRVGQIISGHVDGLHRGDGTLLRCSTADISGNRQKSWTAYIRSCIPPMSVDRVGWYPTAEGIRPSNADTWKTSARTA